MRIETIKASIKRLTAATAALAFTASVQAAGGLDVIKEKADGIKTTAFSILGVFALIYLIYLAIMAMAEKKQWSDFGMGVVHVIAAGATISLGTWAWGIFSA
jgi:hypothetical protein